MGLAFGIDPDELRSTAQRLADVSADMKDVMSALTSALNAEGAPWGDDKTGTQFANGDSGDDGYVAQRDWVTDSVEVKTDLLDGYADDLREAADQLEQLDDDS